MELRDFRQEMRRKITQKMKAILATKTSKKLDEKKNIIFKKIIFCS
jgi:hypothetical protein